MSESRTSVRAAFAAFAIIAAVMTVAVVGRTDQMSSSTPTPGPTSAPIAVKIVNYAFSPQKVTIPVGGSVTWTNNDEVAHTATASENSFDSGNLNKGQTWTHTFTKAGKYAYICTYHPNMTGTIVVQDAAATPAPTGY